MGIYLRCIVVCAALIARATSKIGIEKKMRVKMFLNDASSSRKTIILKTSRQNKLKKMFVSVLFP